MRGCFCDCDFSHVESFRGKFSSRQGGAVVQGRRTPFGVWALSWMVPLLGPLSEEGDLCASVSLPAPACLSGAF